MAVVIQCVQKIALPDGEVRLPQSSDYLIYHFNLRDLYLKDCRDGEFQIILEMLFCNQNTY